MRTRVLVFCVVAVGIAWLAVSAQVDAPVVGDADTGQKLSQASADEAANVLDSTQECSVDSSFEMDEALMSRGGPPCKKCKGRSWCECTYQGKPRISCDPCCYQGPFDPLPVCFD